jgi:hypothetical protein
MSSSVHSCAEINNSEPEAGVFPLPFYSVLLEVLFIDIRQFRQINAGSSASE